MRRYGSAPVFDVVETTSVLPKILVIYGRLYSSGGPNMRMTYLNATPSLFADRHLTSHRRNERNQSKLKSRNCGISSALSMSIQAPPAERSRTVHPITLRRSDARS